MFKQKCAYCKGQIEDCCFCGGKGRVWIWKNQIIRRFNRWFYVRIGWRYEVWRDKYSVDYHWKLNDEWFEQFEDRINRFED